MASIAFIGDSHLGYRHRFKEQRLADFQKAFEEAVSKALCLNPDAVVFTGDLVHHSKPDPVSMRVVLRKLMEVAGRCPVIVCIGNHEIEGHLGTTYSPIYGDVHPNIQVLSSDNPHVKLELKGVEYGFHGFEYTRSRQAAEEKLRNLQAGVDSTVNILCLHQAVEHYLSPHELSLSSLREAAPKYDFIALGHIHRHQPIKEVCDVTPAFYCGSTEHTSFNEASNQNGFLLVDSSNFTSPMFIEVDSAKMTHLKGQAKGNPENINSLIQSLIESNREPLLKIDYVIELEGDYMDVRRDWSAFAAGRTILEVNLTPKSSQQAVSLEKVELNENLIREYFQKTGNTNRELEELCVELYRRHAS